MKRYFPGNTPPPKSTSRTEQHAFWGGVSYLGQNYNWKDLLNSTLYISIWWNVLSSLISLQLSLDFSTFLLITSPSIFLLFSENCCHQLSNKKNPSAFHALHVACVTYTANPFLKFHLCLSDIRMTVNYSSISFHQECYLFEDKTIVP